MDKEQALHEFWSGFNIPAYDENSVPDTATMPYITYNVSVDAMDAVLPLSGSIWYDSTNWRDITLKEHEIEHKIGYAGIIRPITDGYMMLYKGTPFAQRIANEKSNIKQIYINIGVEFLTEE